VRGLKPWTIKKSNKDEHGKKIKRIPRKAFEGGKGRAKLRRKEK